MKKQGKKRGSENRQAPLSYWMTVGALLASSTVGAATSVGGAPVIRPPKSGLNRGDGRQSTPAAASSRFALPPEVQEAIFGRQARQSQAPSRPQTLRTTVHRFEIAPGPLETALDAFERLTSLRVEIVNTAVRRISSPGVSGSFTPEQALQRLLGGTGVGYRFTSAQVIALEIEGVTASVEIVGRISPSSPKYTEPLRDTPQTIAIIPKAVIEEQGATTLRDVLRNVPGLTVAAGEGGVPAGDNLTLRGFSARNDLFVDGVRDLSPQSRDPFNLEQVEVVKGPGSAFTGRGSAGGTINLVSKAPGLDPSFGGTLAFGTDETRRATIDVNLPLKRIGLGERTAFRLNFLGHESGVAGREAVENQRWGVAPSLAFGVGTTTRLTLSYFRLTQDNLPDYGIPWVTATHNLLAEYRDQPAPVPRDNFYGQTARDYEKMESDFGTLRFERDFSDLISLRHQLRYGRSTRDSVTTAPRFAGNDSLVINRNGPSWITDDRIWDNQTDLRARFSTGSIDHALVGGFGYTHETNYRRTRTVTGTPTTTLYNPDPDQPFTGTFTLGTGLGDVTGKTVSLYAFDTAKLHEKFELTGGLRWDRFDVDGVTTALAPVARVDDMVSWRLGAVYKPRPQGSLYAAYGTSLSPSLEGLSYQTANTAIEPEKTYNLEVGSKWEMFGDRVLLNGAVFRIEKTHARTPGLLPDDPPQVLQGRQRVNGFELGATGNLTRRWQVLGAYTFLDGEITRSNTPAEIGKSIQNTPRNSLSVWMSYQLPWEISVGGGPRFTGRRFGNVTNTRSVDGYWLLDAMVSFPVTKKIALRLNLYNLTNEYYFDRLGGGHLIPGAGRAAMLGTSFRF